MRLPTMRLLFFQRRCRLKAIRFIWPNPPGVIVECVTHKRFIYDSHGAGETFEQGERKAEELRESFRDANAKCLDHVAANADAFWHVLRARIHHVRHFTSVVKDHSYHDADEVVRLRCNVCYLLDKILAAPAASVLRRRPD